MISIAADLSKWSQTSSSSIIMALQSSERVWQESRLLSLMISIVDNTTEQASKLDVSFQLDFYLNKQANMHPA